MSVSVPRAPLADAKPGRLRPDEVARRCALPNGACRIEIYGLDGRLHRSDEPDGSCVVFRYDLDGELRAMEHSSGERVRYEGGIGHQTLRSLTARCTTTIEFDAGGFPARLRQRVDDFEWCIEYRRDDIGRVLACLYPQAHDWLRSAGRQSPDVVSTEVSVGSLRYFRVSVGPDQQEIAFADGTRTVQHTSQGTCLEKISVHDRHDGERLATGFEMDQGRLTRAGEQSFEYDDAGRLTRCAGPGQDVRYEYDGVQRLTAIGSSGHATRLAYAEHPAPVLIDDDAVTYDPLGRRTSRGGTRYRYNSFGQLTEVLLAGGPSIRYVYDGFGRLVARECGRERVYYVVDLEGHRICEADATGTVRRSYLWQGAHCIAEIDGVIGNPLAHSFHRVHGGRLQALGTSDGDLITVPAVDPYGADQIRRDGIPSFGSLFADPATRLYHAGSRWFDPATAQFLTPDGWLGTDAWNHMPIDMRAVFDALPSGTNVVLTPEMAYAWCRYDPINYSDPNGHSVATGFGMFYSIVSFFLWQMQVTTIALKMAAVNFVVMLLPSLIDLIVSGIKGAPLWGVNVFNAIFPLIASSRLMVPWAFPLNSLYNASGSVFTMGSVIWMRGSQHRGLERSSKRDILVCANASDYLAAGSVAADAFAVPRANIKGTGTMNAAADRITGAVIDPALAPITLVQAFGAGDALGVHKTAGGPDEFPVLTNVGTMRLNLALPADFAGVAVDFFRLDQPLVKIAHDGRTIARSITFVRGQSIHYQKQLPDGFPESGLDSSEYLPTVDRKQSQFTPNREFLLIEFSASDIGSYNPGDFLRILSGATYFGRKAERKHASKNLILDVALPPGGAPPLDPKVDVAVMTAAAEAPANNQSSAGDKVTVGAIRTLRKQDGLLITGGAGPDIDRRIVLQTFLRCTVDNLPAALHGQPLKIDLLLLAVTRGNGKVSAADTVTVGKDEAAAFKEKQPVRITTAAGKEFAAVIKQVTAAAETLQFTEPLPAADFPLTTAVTVVLLTAFKTLDCEPAAAPGGSLDVKSDDLANPVADELVLVRPATGADTPAIRKVKAPPPVVVAQVDSAPRNNANLTVQVFTPDKARTHRGEVKNVVLRLTPVGGPHPYAANDEIYCVDGDEEYVGKNLAPAGADVILEDPISTPGFGAAFVAALQVQPTGKRTAGASLGESLLAIPSDPDEDPVGRGRAVELHEMRHVWQYAVLGPFFFSQPLPWLFRLGWAPDFRKRPWLRLLSTGGLERLFSVLVWGIGGFDKATSVNATVANAERTRLTFAADVSADDMAKFTEDAPIEVRLPDNSVFNVIDKAAPSERRIDLRFPLEDEFTQGSAVRITVSPFEKLNAVINDIFDFSKLWSPLLPPTWTRALKGFMNRDNWFPFLGLYPLALLRAGGDQSKMYFEQDASFQSGDVYTDFGVSYPNALVVGEFSRVFAFISGRGAGDLATGLSARGSRITRTLTVEPVHLPGGKTARDLIPGTASAGGHEVRFRRELMIPMNEKVENVMGAMFLANTPGEYKVLSSGFSLDDMVDPALWLPPFIPFFPTSFNELRIITVKELTVDKKFTAADPLFETESATFVIKGAKDVTYTIDYKGPRPAVAGIINGLSFTAPRLAAGAVVHQLAITSHYRANHHIFDSKGKLHDKIALPAAALSNVCQDLDVAIALITVDAVPPTKVGKTAQFNASIDPTTILRTTGPIAEAAVQADLTRLGGRPAKLRFRAPNKVNAAQDVKFKLTFGTAPNHREIDVTIRVEP